MARLKSKKSAGRRKIEMKFIEQENARTVTFSKRRAGLFKKATELSILCGAQVAVIIFSLCGRAYTFGHPTVENVLARFFNRSPMPNLQDSVHGRRIHAATIQQLKEQVEEARKELDKKKRRRKELELALENSPYQTSDESLSRMSLDQLKEIKERMVKLREDIVCQIDAAKSKSDADAIKDEEKVAFDLANVEGDGDGCSSIPSDWLKL